MLLYRGWLGTYTNSFSKSSVSWLSKLVDHMGNEPLLYSSRVETFGTDNELLRDCHHYQMGVRGVEKIGLGMGRKKEEKTGGANDGGWQ